MLARAILRKSTDKGRDGHIPAGVGMERGAFRSPLGSAAVHHIRIDLLSLSEVSRVWLSWFRG